MQHPGGVLPARTRPSRSMILSSPVAGTKKQIPESGICFIDIFRGCKPVAVCAGPGRPQDPNTAFLWEMSWNLSQHNIQQHHNGKPKNDSHGSKIGLILLISLTFRNQLVDSDQNHCAGCEGEGVGQNRFHIDNQ